MFSLYQNTAAHCSRIITEAYSTSFSLGIKALHKRFHEPIYGIYGFVRYADEIVDTFHDYDKRLLLQNFKRDTYLAIEQGISLNPILHSFQTVANKYHLPLHLIESFFRSMEMDLDKTQYGREVYDEYIYGSAEVVGLMCLKVFTEGDEQLYEQLKAPAKALGAAFQKINFLRDMKSDYDERGRVYFPGIDFDNFKESAKRQIEAEIEDDFKQAYSGIITLPAGARPGVWLAFKYYLKLFNRIKKVPATRIKTTRIRVPDLQKLMILAESVIQNHIVHIFLKLG